MEKKYGNVISINEYRKQKKKSEVKRELTRVKPVHVWVGLIVLAGICVFLYQSLIQV